MAYDANVAAIQMQVQLAGQNQVPITGEIDTATRQAFQNLNSQLGFGQGIGAASLNQQLIDYLSQYKVNAPQPATSYPVVPTKGLSSSPTNNQASNVNSSSSTLDPSTFMTDPMSSFWEDNPLVNNGGQTPQNNGGLITGGLNSIMGSFSMNDVIGAFIIIALINAISNIFGGRK